MNFDLRKGMPVDAERLTEIAFAAKKSWDYPESYFDFWNDELEISTQYIKDNIVFVAVYHDQVIGFYSIVIEAKGRKVGEIEIEKGYWMDHLFIDPKYQRKGVGRKLLQHALDYCQENWIETLKVFVDPYAAKFYEKMGAQFIKHSSSSIPGRTIPVYQFEIEE